MLERLNQLNIQLQLLESKETKTVGDIWKISDLKDELQELKQELNRLEGGEEIELY